MLVVRGIIQFLDLIVVSAAITGIAGIDPLLFDIIT